MYDFLINPQKYFLGTYNSKEFPPPTNPTFSAYQFLVRPNMCYELVPIWIDILHGIRSFSPALWDTLLRPEIGQSLIDKRENSSRHVARISSTTGETTINAISKFSQRLEAINFSHRFHFYKSFWHLAEKQTNFDESLMRTNLHIMRHAENTKLIFRNID